MGVGGCCYSIECNFGSQDIVRSALLVLQFDVIVYVSLFADHSISFTFKYYE